jgi:Cof subfamily protein (haloacid dehalogenase superfamily)
MLSLVSRASGPRLVVCDLDGTLVAGHAPPSERVRRAVAGCAAAGVAVVLATGRSPRGVEPVAAALGLSGGVHIFNNRALVQDFRGRARRRTLLARDVTASVVRACVAHGVAVAVHRDGRVLTPAYDGMPAISAHAIARGIAEAVGIAEVLAGRATQVTVAVSPPDEAAAIAVVRAACRDRAAPIRAEPGVFDIVAAGVDKGAALRRLAASWGIDRVAVAAIGDGDNDLPLFAAAGLRIAMGNATAALKGLADWSVGSVTEDGAAHALESLVRYAEACRHC